MTASTLPARLALALDERAYRAGGWPLFIIRGACWVASLLQGMLIGLLMGVGAITTLGASLLVVGSVATWFHGHLSKRS